MNADRYKNLISHIKVIQPWIYFCAQFLRINYSRHGLLGCDV